jgi:hypothetical protein
MQTGRIRLRVRIGLAAVCLWMIAAACSAAERSYWVWGKRGPLSADETRELQRQGVRTLYWQAATVDGKKVPVGVADGSRNLAERAPGFTVIPVLRVEPGPVPSAAYFRSVRAKVPALQGEALQIDFDCPDRLLGEYAALLAELRATWPKLGITALAHWPGVKDFPQLARSVSEMCPMFYDLQRDPTGVKTAADVPPLLDPAQVEGFLARWKSCPTPWRAGLPVFTRVTVFDQTGLSRGQIFQWDWDQIVFHPQLRSLAPGKLGVFQLRAAERTIVAGKRVEEGEMLTVRLTDRGALNECLSAAERAGAMGAVFFRLPKSNDPSTCSLQALGEAAAPRYVLRREGEALVLANESSADVPPRLAGERHDRDRGYELEIDAPIPSFREAEPGAFFRVAAHVSPESKPQPASVQTATRLTFWFSHLPAGESLRSGLFQLSPTVDPARLRWRVRGGDWQPFLQP